MLKSVKPIFSFLLVLFVWSISAGYGMEGNVDQTPRGKQLRKIVELLEKDGADNIIYQYFDSRGPTEFYHFFFTEIFQENVPQEQRIFFDAVFSEMQGSYNFTDLNGVLLRIEESGNVGALYSSLDVLADLLSDNTFLDKEKYLLPQEFEDYNLSNWYNVTVNYFAPYFSNTVGRYFSETHKLDENASKEIQDKLSTELFLNLLVDESETGSGFLFKNKVVTTASHVLESFSQEKNNISFYDSNRSAKPIAVLEKREIKEKDLALLRIEALELSEGEIGLLDAEAVKQSQGDIEKFLVIGYPGSKKLKELMYFSTTNFQFNAEEENQIIIDVPTIGGLSGSPVFAVMKSKNVLYCGIMVEKLNICNPLKGKVSLFTEDCIKLLQGE